MYEGKFMSAKKTSVIRKTAVVKSSEPLLADVRS